MRSFPTLALAKKALLPALLASLALALPQNQGTAYSALSSSTSGSTTSTSTHLSPSLIHSSLPTPGSPEAKNDQGADIMTETIFSTIIIPTATELTTILTVVTNGPHATTSTTSASTTTPSASTSKSAGPNPHCVVEGGEDGICVTVVPIWPTDTLAPAVKRQANNTAPVSHSISYYSTALVTSLVVVHPTVTKVVTEIVGPSTTYMLSGPLATPLTSSTPANPTTTAPAVSTSTTISCPSPSWLIDGRCVYNTPGWNPAPQIPTETEDFGVTPHPPWVTGVARAVKTNQPQALAQAKKMGHGLRGYGQREDEAGRR